jgi:ABC-type hemin transport system substrate-binding protein
LRSRGAILSLLLLVLLAGCGKGEERAAAGSAASCRRVIALAPNLSETLFALGLGARVVGVDDYSHWPPEVETLPRLGGLFNPNLERIVSLHPDLALLVPSERDIGEKLRRFEIDSLIVSNETLADIERSFHKIAGRCGVPEAGARLAAEWRDGLRPAAVPGAPRVLLSTGRPAGRLVDLVVAGPGTFLDELLHRLGAVNAFADAPIRYPEVGMEEIVARAPDVVIELRADPLSAEVAGRLVDDWRALPQLPAVREKRVQVISGDHVLIPGPRLPQFYRELRKALGGAE